LSNIRSLISNLQILISYLKENKVNLFFLFLIGLASNLLSIIIPVSIGKYFDLEFNVQAKKAGVLNVLPNYFTESTSGFLVFFVILILLRFIFFIIFQYKLKAHAEKFIKEVKDRLFEHQLSVDHKIYHKYGMSKYLLRYSGDMTSLKNLFTSGTISFIIDVLIALICFMWLVYLDYIGGLIVIITTIFFYFLLYFVNRKIEYFSRKKRDATSGQLSFVNRSFNAIISIIGFNKEYTEVTKFNKRTTVILSNGINLGFWDSINKGLIAFMQFGVLVIVFIVFHFTKKQQSTPGDLISFILLYLTILPALTRLYRIETVFTMGLISIQKINEIFDLPKNLSDEGVKLKPLEKPSFEVKNLSIKRSTPLNFVLNENVQQLRLPKELKTIDFIKTILRINRFYKGIILINNQNLKRCSPKSVRRQVVVISTQLPFIGNTVFEAISYSRNEESKEDVAGLLSNFQSKYKFSHPLTLMQEIGENGKNLTPIQKEFLAIARALLTDKKLIFIDKLPHLSQIENFSLNKILDEYNACGIYLL
jgi:ABC-type multidrug transport system fused ATPase/permease subunit